MWVIQNVACPMQHSKDDWSLLLYILGSSRINSILPHQNRRCLASTIIVCCHIWQLCTDTCTYLWKLWQWKLKNSMMWGKCIVIPHNGDWNRIWMNHWNINQNTNACSPCHRSQFIMLERSLHWIIINFRLFFTNSRFCLQCVPSCTITQIHL